MVTSSPALAIDYLRLEPWHLLHHDRDHLLLLLRHLRLLDQPALRLLEQHSVRRRGAGVRRARALHLYVVASVSSSSLSVVCFFVVESRQKNVGSRGAAGAFISDSHNTRGAAGLGRVAGRPICAAIVTGRYITRLHPFGDAACCRRWGGMV